MARNRLLDAFKEARSITRHEMPNAESMQKYLDIIIPQVRQWSEDLREERFYIGKSWYELRDDDAFHDHVLHFFNEEGEYMRSENGDVSNGSWKLVGSSNRMIIDYETTEMYDMAFMNENFLILQKLGDQVRLGKDKYFFMVNEGMYRSFKKKTKRGLEWPDAMQLLYRIKYDHSQFYQTLTIVVLMIVIIVLIYSLI